VRDDIIDSAKLSKSPYVRDLWLRGDEAHQSVNIGRIVGHTQIPRLVDVGKDWLETSEKKLAQLRKRGVKRLLLDETYFGVKRHGIRNFFRPLDVVVAVANAWEIKEQEGKITEKIHQNGKNGTENLTQHSKLVGNVELFGPALNRVGEYFYLPSYASSPVVDQIQTMDIIRKHSFYVLNAVGVITDKSLDSNVALQIALETKNLLDADRGGEEKK
jgi:hypothetical protein